MVGPLRVFAAVAPPHEVRQALVDQLSDVVIPGKVVPPANWHLTLRFLGDIDEVACDRYLAALDSRDLGRRFKVRLANFGAFPNHRKATVTWLGVAQGEQRLFQLAEQADEAAVDIGLLPEDRPFSPHLTLSRVRPPVNVAALVQEVECDVEWRVESVVIFRSLLVGGRVGYEPIETFELLR